jgi:hypothetical protein
MNQPETENPKASKRSKRKAAMEPLGWDEIVSQPGMGGYLSFLNGPVPLPHLQNPDTGSKIDPVVASPPRSGSIPEVASTPDVGSAPEAKLIPLAGPATEGGGGTALVRTPEVDSTSGVLSGPEVQSIPVSAPASGQPEIGSHPEVDSTTVDLVYAPPGQLTAPGVVLGPGVDKRRFRIRRCAAAHDGHSLGEEVLYQALWKSAAPESADTRTIVIGWRGMCQLCRMTPKNCKINTQRLIRKLALEVLSPYNTPESIGTTYRVYSDSSILKRRREAGLEWVVRSRGVDFVNPKTGQSILPICAVTHRNDPI